MNIQEQYQEENEEDNFSYQYKKQDYLNHNEECSQ